VNTSDKYYAEEKANWDKYFPFVANKEAIVDDHFWAVTEAKIIEGSAVLKGSNYATPTISITVPKNIEPDLSTQTAAAEAKSLQKTNQKQLLSKLIKNQF
jgi:predicted flavoprotein YhiN